MKKWPKKGNKENVMHAFKINVNILILIKIVDILCWACVDIVFVVLDSEISEIKTNKINIIGRLGSHHWYPI